MRGRTHYIIENIHNTEKSWSIRVLHVRHTHSSRSVDG